MKCPKCGKHDMSKVIDSRRRNGGYVIRRHECMCGHRFNTIEIVELNDKTLTAIGTIMRDNCEPRAFERAISAMYDKIFNFAKYIKDKQAGNVA